MPRPRAFDWDEARRLQAEGLTYTAIAKRLGVRYQSVRRACDEAVRERIAAYQRTGVCPDCGTQTTRYAGGVSSRCPRCAGKRAATTVRPDTLQCLRCREWKPDSAFPRNRGGALVRRGRHDSCRVCGTVIRREYRERHKIPCESCGKPRLPAGEKGSGIGRRDTGLCRDCYRATLRKPIEAAA